MSFWENVMTAGILLMWGSFFMAIPFAGLHKLTEKAIPAFSRWMEKTTIFIMSGVGVGLLIAIVGQWAGFIYGVLHGAHTTPD
jgi:uncharacterized membrane protein